MWILKKLRLEKLPCQPGYKNVASQPTPLAMVCHSGTHRPVAVLSAKVHSDCPMEEPVMRRRYLKEGQTKLEVSAGT